MSETHIFSTGALTAQIIAPFIAARGHYQGGPPSAPSATPVANLSDGNPLTVASCNADTGGYEYFLLDLGASLSIAQIRVTNATVGNGAILGVQVSNANSLAGIPGDGAGAPAGTTMGLVAASGNVAPVMDAALTFLPAAGTSVTGRYLYVTFVGATGGATVTIGEIAVSVILPFGLVQETTLEIAYQRKELFDAAQVSAFPVESADDQGRWVLKIKNAAVQTLALQQLIAASLAALPGPPAASVATLPAAIKLPFLTAALTLTDTTGKTVTVTLNHCKADGVQIPFKLSDFAIQDFTLMAYPDIGGNLGTIAFQN